MTAIRQGLTQLADASREALMGIRKASDKTTDMDVIRYENFTPEQFSAMEEEYGTDNVLEYIKEMELKRLAPLNNRR